MSKGLVLLGAVFVGLSTLLSGQSAWEGAYFNFEVANDVLYLPIKTDQYFTSGLSLEIGKREVGSAPFRPGGSLVMEQYWRLTQNIYTPRQINALNLQEDDRPFASYLVATRGKSFSDGQLGLGVRWEFTAGILGRYAGGGVVQNAWHSILSFADPVPGWTYEVKPDVVLNYELAISQHFAATPRFGFTAALTGRVGTLYTNLEPQLRFNWLAIRMGERHTLEFEMLGMTRLVGYDATLSGGLLNRDDRYRGRVRPKRLVGTFGFDGTILFGDLRLSGGFRHLETEFQGGRAHAWAWFSVGVRPAGR